jgi:UDP-glucose 4-epimerase
VVLMRYFITGGAGCIGSELAERLGNDVVIYDNFSTGKEEHLKGKRFVKGDILDLKTLTKHMKNVDVVFHLAANSSTKYHEGDPTDKDVQVNIVGTYNVLEAMRRNNVKKLVFLSSQTVYGEGAKKFSETDMLNPISLYGASKAAGEQMIQGFCSMFGMQAWILRLANVVGNKSRKAGVSVMPDFIGKLQKTPKALEILGNGKQEKSYIFMDDCLDALLLCLDRAKDKINIYNIGSADTIAVESIGAVIIEEMKLKNVKITHTAGDRGWTGDVPCTKLDLGKIRKLGWKPKYTSAEAVRASAAGLLKGHV